MSVKTIYARACEHPSKPAVIHNGAIINYAAFASAIQAALDYLDSQDLGEDQIVVVIIHNLLDCWVVVLALQYLGVDTLCVRSTQVLETLGLNNVPCLVTTETEFSLHQIKPDI